METLKEALMALGCVLYAPIRGTAKRQAASPSRIVIIQMAKLGDMVCTTPVFRAIKAAYPDAHLTVVGSAINREVLAGNADVDEYYTFTGISALIRKLRAGKYAFGAITTPSTMLFGCLFLGNVRTIAAPTIPNGRSSYETSLYRRISRLAIRVPHSFGAYAPREYLRVLEPIGIHATDTAKHLSYSDAARTRVSKLWDSFNYAPGTLVVGITPSAGNKTKLWPAERFAELARLLHEKHTAEVMLIGGMRDEKEIARLQEILGDVPWLRSCTDLSIDELKAFIPRLSLLLGVDTGPLYIAEAFGVPTVDIVGPVDEREQPPVGEKHVLVVPPGPRVPQLHIMDVRSYDLKEVQRQIDSITVPMVYEACEELLSRMHGGPR